MHSFNSFKSNVFRTNNQNFERHALELFNFQYANNAIYRKYVQFLNIRPDDVKKVAEIPFLPIRFFKNHTVKTGDFIEQKIFESSGTTGDASKHFVEDLDFYAKVCTKIFTSSFGKLDKSVVIGLLPSYLERGNSSLVYMVNHFIKLSQNDHSGFYLDDMELLIQKLKMLAGHGFKVHFFGVTFALLELASRYSLDMENVCFFETGGMKGRGKELTREELHLKLRRAFNTNHVFSEYGMTELLSQAYLQKDGKFHAPPWMQVRIREIHDPFKYTQKGQVGVISIVDLANVHSCAFIETEDLGMLSDDGFNVIGRLDNSDLRGCNLLIS